MLWWLMLKGLVGIIDALGQSIQAISDTMLSGLGFPITVNVLPFGVDQYFTNAFATIYAVADFFPPAITMIHLSFIVMVYLVIRRMVLPLLLGGRAPVQY